MPTYLVNLGIESIRVKDCADILQFTRKWEGSLKLHQTWFCGSRYARAVTAQSLKHSNQVIQIINEAVKENLKDVSFGR